MSCCLDKPTEPLITLSERIDTYLYIGVKNLTDSKLSLQDYIAEKVKKAYSILEFIKEILTNLGKSRSFPTYNAITFV